MTVGELIKKLKKLPQNLDVVIYDEYDHRWLDEAPSVFPDKQMEQEMLADGHPVEKRVVLSFNGKYDS